MKIKHFIILIILIFASNIFALTDKENNKNTEDLSWINNYISIDPSDDLFSERIPKWQTISKDYVINLKWHQDIDFFIDEIDDYNLRKNINILPRFPYIYMLYGGYSYNRGFDLGFLFRADNVANSNLAFTAASSFSQNGKFWLHTNFEYPALLNYRLKLLGTLSFFTSGPQYYSAIAKYYDSNFLMNLFNKVWDIFGISFYRQNDLGFYFVTGFDYRIPFIETNIITTVNLKYQYDIAKIDRTSPPDIIPLDNHNFGLNIKEEIRFNKLKQTATLPVGFYLSAMGDFYLPTSIGFPNDQLRFRSRIEAKFNKKLFREFAIKSRLLIAANYNISEDFSGDPHIRGFADHELTGWFALLANFEAYIPLVDIDMKSAFSNQLKKDAKFVIFLMIFVDGGFTIENYNYYLDNFYERKKKEDIKNSISFYVDKNDKYLGAVPGGQAYLGKGHYLLPAITTGGGIHFYPYFLHFIIRLDVGVNILKAAIYRSPGESVEITFSFSQTF